MKKYVKSICIAAGLACCVSLVVATIGCAGDRYHRSTGAYLDDKAISAKVKTDLLTDPQTKGTQIQVETYQGKVQLSGFVDTSMAKQRATDIARRVNGVQWVRNDLVVKASIPGGAAAGAQSAQPSGTQSQGTAPQSQQPAETHSPATTNP